MTRYNFETRVDCVNSDSGEGVRQTKTVQWCLTFFCERLPQIAYANLSVVSVLFRALPLLFSFVVLFFSRGAVVFLSVAEKASGECFRLFRICGDVILTCVSEWCCFGCFCFSLKFRVSGSGMIGGRTAVTGESRHTKDANGLWKS